MDEKPTSQDAPSRSKTSTVSDLWRDTGAQDSLSWQPSDQTLIISSVQSLVHKVFCSFLSVLSVAQWRKIDFLPIKWQPALQQIGAGGSANIQQSIINLSIDFAFKRLSLSAYSLPDDEALYRALIAEISVLGHPIILNHPNVLRLEGVCWDIEPKNKTVYPALVFEKAVYGDLGCFKRSQLAQKMTIADKMLLCAHVANALATMHSCGIAHGDLKPANVLVFRENDDRISAKVADFGFSSLSRSDEVIFLPQSEPWNAPEWHHRGFNIDQAKRQDVYSFGLLCLWFLSPDEFYPYKNEAFQYKESAADGEMLQLEFDSFVEQLKQSDQLRHQAIKAIDKIQGLNENQRRNLESLFYAALAFEPLDRTCDFETLLRLLYSEASGTSAGPSLVFSEQDVIPLDSDFQIIPNLDQFVKADYQLRQHIADCLEYQYSRSQNGDTAFQVAVCWKLGFGRKRNDEVCYQWLIKSKKDVEVLDTAIATIRKRRSWQYINKKIYLLNEHGFLHWAQLSIQDNQELLQAAKQECARELEDMQEVLGTKHTIVYVLRTTLALFTEAQGNLRLSQKIQEILVRDFVSDPDYGPDHVSTLTSVSNLADTYLKLGQLDEAEEMNRNVFRKSMEVLGTKNAYTLVSANNLATLLQHKGQYQEAERLHRDTLAHRREILGIKHSATLTSINNLAQTFSMQGNFEEAQIMHRQCVRESIEVLGPEHPFVLAGKNNLAEVLESQGCLEESEQICREVLQIKERVLGPHHRSTLNTLNNLALVLQAQGKLVEARDMHAYGCSKSEELLGAEHPSTITSMGNLAYAKYLLGDHEAAEELQGHTIEVSARILGNEHPDTLLLKVNMAQIIAHQDRLAEAEQLYRSVLEDLEKSLGKDHYITQECSRGLMSVTKNGRS